MFYSLAFIMLFVVVFEVFKSFSTLFCRKVKVDCIGKVIVQRISNLSIVS